MQRNVLYATGLSFYVSQISLGYKILISDNHHLDTRYLHD